MVAWSSLLPLVGLTLSVVLGTAAAQDQVALAASKPLIEDIPNAYIVEFVDNYGIDALLDDLKRKAISLVKRKDLNFRLFNGASFDLKGKVGVEAEEAVRQITGHTKVKQIWPVRKVMLPNDKFSSIGAGIVESFEDFGDGGFVKRQSSNDTYNLHVQTQVDKLHAQGFTGKGIKIAIIDSGIDYKHPSLGGCFGKGCKVSFGYDLVGDDLARPGQFPDSDPMDCAGHGTHVAGIVGANRNSLGFLGVAPDAELGAYKALNCVGYSTNELLISAFNMAYEDGADIISSSTGIEGGWADDAWSLAASRIVDAGVPVVIAAGNSGEQGLWRPSSPATGRGVSSVASIDNTDLIRLVLAGTYKLDGGDAVQFPWLANDPPLGNLTLPLRLLVDSAGTQLDACQRLPDNVSLEADAVYLVAESNDCAHQNLIDFMADRGAKHVMIHTVTNSPAKQPLHGSSPKANAGLTTQDQGEAWVKALKAGSKITMTTLEPDHSPNLALRSPNKVSGGYTSYWSSWGPDWELFATPSLAAPGGDILSTYPLTMGSYSVASGTSMATPFVAGALALLAQKKKTKNSEMLRTLLATTAKPVVHHDGQKVDPMNRLHSVLQGGPGLIQLFDASEVKGILSTAFISFNDTEFNKDVTFSLKNTGLVAATYELGHRAAATVYALDNKDPHFIQRFPVELAPAAAVAEISFSKDVVKVPAGGSVSITVKAIPPTANVDMTRQPFYSGFITLNGTNGDILKLPYLGLAGTALRKTDVIPQGRNNMNLPLAYIADSTNSFPSPVKNDTVYRIPLPTIPPSAPGRTVFPQARIAQALGTRSFSLRVVPLELLRNDTIAETEDWHGFKTLPADIYGPANTLLPRGSVWQTFEGLLADGSTAPEGKYKIVVAALRLFGDRNKEDDWDVRELSPSFTIRYT